MRKFIFYLGLTLVVQVLIQRIMLSTGFFELPVYFLYFVPWILLDAYAPAVTHWMMADGSANLWLMLGAPALLYAIALAGVAAFVEEHLRRALGRQK